MKINLTSKKKVTSKGNKLKVFTLFLAVLLIFSISYISFEKYQNIKVSQLQEGYNLGITASVVSIMQQTDDCKVTTVTIGNHTRKIVDYECYRALQEK